MIPGNHLTSRQRDAIAEASRDRANFAGRVEPVISLDGSPFAEGDADFQDLVEECRYGEEDGVAVVLTATLLGRLSPREYEQTECRVDWLVTRDDGTVVTCPGFLGEIKTVTRRGMFTTIAAATEGSEASETPIGERKADDRDYSGFRPDTVLFDVFSLLAGYAGVEIPRIPEPVLDARKEPFSWTRVLGEVVEWAETQARVRAADLPWNVASAYALRPVDGEPDWDAAEGRDLPVGEIADDTPEGERFARVVVVRQEEGGTETPLAWARVDNGDRRVNPRSVKVLPYDASEATEGPDANRRTAYAVAYEEAERLSGLPARLTVPLSYPPFFLGRGHRMLAATREYLKTSVLSARHLMRCEQVVVDARAKSGQVAGEGRLLGTQEEPMPVPSFRPPGGTARPLWGGGADGSLDAHGSLGWVYVDENGDLDAAPGAPITLDAEGYDFALV